MRFTVVTLLPKLFESFLENGIVGQAHEDQKFAVQFVNPREFSSDKYKTADDRPFGGGDGMVLMADPLEKAMGSLELKSLRNGDRPQRVVYLSPQGKTWSDQTARTFSKSEELVLICGRYGGIDERFLSLYVDEEISIGDYVLSGGELASMVVIDSIVRLLPGVLGNRASSENESFADGLLEAPLYTRPRVFGGLEVPPVLLGGNHGEIEKWRRMISILRTAHRRPDLLKASGLSQLELREAERFYEKMNVVEKQVVGLPPTCPLKEMDHK